MSKNTLLSTFYSYKGGVGRTLALVNTAVALTRKGHNVIIWDMDIEAPGAQNIPYFKPLRANIKGGFVDIAADFKANNYRKIDEKKFESYLVTHPENEKLRLLPTGNLEKDKEYAEKFTAIEWDKLFGKGKQAGYILFELIRAELLKYNPDFVLIDSRTGITDIGGVCCVQLPEV
ncbi:MAG: KGGVGR-motif variant AAA ATPase, partial [Candidatus Anammoxibacter sp.]